MELNKGGIPYGSNSFMPNMFDFKHVSGANISAPLEFLTNPLRFNNLLHVSGANWGIPNFRQPSLSVDTQTDAIGSESNTPWGMIVSSAMANVGGFFDGINPSIHSNDLLQEAGTTNSSIRGVGYQVLNNIDADRIRSEYDKNNFSKIWSGNIGGFIGGLFGKSKVNREIEKAQLQANRTTNFNRDVAATKGIQMDFRSKYGNPEGLVLYTAAKGKPFGFTPKIFGQFGLISTPDGVSFGTPNAEAHNNEPMFRENEDGSISASTVKTGQGGGENAPVYADDRTVLLGKNPSLSGPPYEDVARPLVKEIERINNTIANIENPKSREIAEKASANKKREIGNYLSYLADEQEMTRPYFDYTNLPKAKYGKDALPKMKLGGGVSNAIAGILGTGMSIGQYFDAKNQRAYIPYTYVENPYERRALTDLAGLRINPYNTIQLIKNIAGRANYTTDTAGALSTGLKMLQKTATAANTLNNIANALLNIAEKNISLRSAADTAALNAGAQSASNMMNALRWDSDLYAKSHAARIAGMQTAESNFLALIQQYMANEYKRRMGNAMIDLYSDDLRSRKYRYGKDSWRGKMFPTGYSDYPKSEANMMRRNGYNEDEITEWQNMSDEEKYTALHPKRGIYGGGRFNGAGSTSRWAPGGSTFEGMDFNDSFDNAVLRNIPVFMFDGRLYNTKKELNPVREANNRIVGSGRKSRKNAPINKDYSHDIGPIRGLLNNVPIIVDTYKKRK